VLQKNYGSVHFNHTENVCCNKLDW